MVKTTKYALIHTNDLPTVSSKQNKININKKEKSGGANKLLFDVS